MLNDAVRNENAHFGMTINGDGAVCQIVDEQGRSISPALLASVLQDTTLQRTTNSTTIACDYENGFIPSDDAELDGIETISKLDDAELDGIETISKLDDAELDGIETISKLLTVLSRDDRPLSQVLDESHSAGYDQRKAA